MKKEKLASLGLLTVALIWGIAFTAVDYALDNGWETFTILSLRGLIGGLVLLPFAIKEKFWQSKKLILHCSLAGFFFFVGYASQTYGQQLSSVVNAAFFTCLYVVICPFLAYLFGKKNVTKETFIASFLAITGIFFLSVLASGGKLTFRAGDLLLIMCACFFAMQICWIDKFLVNENKPISKACIMLIVMGLLSIPCSLVAGEAMPTSIKGFGGVLFAALLSSGLCSILQFTCQPYVNAGKASILMGMETAVACIFAWLIGSDKANIYSVTGLVFMMAAVILSSVKFYKHYNFKKYKNLLFDVDDTLLDFKKSEQEAFKKMCKEINLTYSDELLKEYQVTNLKLWHDYEKGLIERKDIFEKRMVPLFENHQVKYDPIKASYRYLELLEDEAYLLDDSLKQIARLSKKYNLYIVTNGEKTVQEKRLKISGLDKYFKDIFISQEIGYQKPSKEYFNYIEKHIEGFKKEETIIIGDSITSDMALGELNGIDTCYFTKEKGENPYTYTIESLVMIR